VVTGYMIALAVVVPVPGFLAEKIGTKRLYMLSMVLFVVGSLLCSLAWDLPSLIVFRIVQGLGGGMLYPLGMAIVYSMLTPLERPRYMAVLGLPTLVAPLSEWAEWKGYLVEWCELARDVHLQHPDAVSRLEVSRGPRRRHHRRAPRRFRASYFHIVFPAPARLYLRRGWTSPTALVFLVVGAATA
jgi:hypothetical protein